MRDREDGDADMESVSVKIPRDWRSEIRRYARQQERTSAAVIRIAIRNHLDSLGKMEGGNDGP